MSYENVGKVWSVDSFKEYLSGLKRPTFAKSVTIHHTGAPSLAQRPNGFTVQHIHNIKGFYQSLGWSKGPHLFIDDDQIFGMTPLSMTGIHAVSFNRTSIGIEILGDYDCEDPLNGRGAAALRTAAAATKALFEWLDIPLNEDTLKFHRDDPKTSKTCPGRKITKEHFIALAQGSSNNSKEQTPPQTYEVSVVEYATQHKGYTAAEAAKALKVKNGMAFFANVWIESARYDKSNATTVASAAELQSDIVKKN